MRHACREQLRGHLLHFLVCHIDRQSALVCDAQPPRSSPSEIVKVRNVRPVCLRQRDFQIAQPRFYVLVLVVKLRVHLHAAPVGFLKVPVYRLLRDPAGLEIFVHHFLNGRLQDLLPCRKRHRERLLDGRRRLPAHPAQIVLRLLRNAVHRQIFIHRRRLFCRFLRCQPRVLLLRILGGRKFFLTFLLRAAYTGIRRVSVGGIVAVNPGSESPGGAVSSFFQRKCVYKIPILALHDVQIEVIHAISRRLLLVNVVDCIYEIMPAFASVVRKRFFNTALAGIIGRFTCNLPDIIRKVQRNKALRPCPSAIAERHLPGEFLTVGFPVKPCRDRTFLAIL